MTCRKSGGRPAPASPQQREAELQRAARRNGEPEIEFVPKVHVPDRALDEKHARRR